MVPESALILDEAQVHTAVAHSDLAHSLRAALYVRKQTIKDIFAGSSESYLRRMFGRAALGPALKNSNAVGVNDPDGQLPRDQSSWTR